MTSATPTERPSSEAVAARMRLPVRVLADLLVWGLIALGWILSLEGDLIGLSTLALFSAAGIIFVLGRVATLRQNGLSGARFWLALAVMMVVFAALPWAVYGVVSSG